MTPAQHAIVADVASEHGLTVADLCGPSRDRRIVNPRQEAMWRLRRAGRWSWPQIGAALGRGRLSAMTGARNHAERRRRADLACWNALGTDGDVR